MLRDHLHSACGEGQPDVEADELGWVRDALSFNKAMETLRYHTALDDLIHNFSRYHGSLRMRLKKPQATRGKKGTPNR